MRGHLVGLVVAGCLVAGSASAAYDRYEPERRKEVNVFLKGGVGGYTGDLSNVTAVGPTWGLTVNLQPLNILGVELGYEGSRNHLNALGDTAVFRNGADALLKIAPPFIERIKPFVGAGLGASYVGVQGNGAGVYRNDFMEEVPLAAGIEFNSRSVTAGIRATYRLLVDENFAGYNRQGGLFDTTLTLGGRF